MQIGRGETVKGQHPGKCRGTGFGRARMRP